VGGHQLRKQHSLAVQVLAPLEHNGALRGQQAKALTPPTRGSNLRRCIDLRRPDSW
jgi:hypothetical protein